MNPERLSLEEAISYLKRGEQVYTFSRGLKTFLFLRRPVDSFTLKNDSFSLVISLKDLLIDFAESSFYLEPQNEEFVDPLKDEEYYSWKQ